MYNVKGDSHWTALVCSIKLHLIKRLHVKINTHTHTQNNLVQANNIWMSYQLHCSNFPLNLSNQAYNIRKLIKIMKKTEIKPEKLHNTVFKETKKQSGLQCTCSAILCLRTLSLSRILRATGSPVSEFLPNLTFANVPSPIVLPTSYLPTLRLILDWLMID